MDQDRIGRRRIAVQGVNTFMAVGLTLEQAIATVKHVMGEDVFRVDRDPELDVDPARRLRDWDHDIEGADPIAYLRETEMQSQDLHGEGAESIGEGAVRKRPIRYE